MKTLTTILCIVFFASNLMGQPKTKDPAFELELKKLLNFEIPTISVKEFKKMLKNEKVYVLDAREKKEYDISHIKGAKLIGHNQLNKNALKGIPKNSTIVVYCTVGVRSEKIGARLKKMGYSNVNNLLGSIIEWVNQDNKVIDSKNKTTKKVHVYNDNYGKWLNKGEKVK